TLGGARPKANVLDGDELWLAKFTSVHDTHPIEQMEVATLLLAEACGIRVPEVRLELATSPYPVALIKRFDRRGPERIPYISARTALAKRGTEAGSYTEIADFIRAWSAAPRADLHELFLRLVFTILVSNKDDHLKNHGFVYAGNDRWRLSRLFDVNPAPEREPHLETAIMEGGPFDRSIDLALESCEFFDLTQAVAAQIIRTAAGTISEKWRSYLARQNVIGARAKHYESAFAHREMDKALSL
ncbi:MAG: HipA domain-containing protein, partial [Phenylobacterium sp.]|nr:HipA domain-containing protein [Phenylobacterium sp.]